MTTPGKCPHGQDYAYYSFPEMIFVRCKCCGISPFFEDEPIEKGGFCKACDESKNLLSTRIHKDMIITGIEYSCKPEYGILISREFKIELERGKESNTFPCPVVYVKCEKCKELHEVIFV